MKRGPAAADSAGNDARGFMTEIGRLGFAPGPGVPGWSISALEPGLEVGGMSRRANVPFRGAAADDSGADGSTLTAEDEAVMDGAVLEADMVDFVGAVWEMVAVDED